MLRLDLDTVVNFHIIGLLTMSKYNNQQLLTNQTLLLQLEMALATILQLAFIDKLHQIPLENQLKLIMMHLQLVLKLKVMI